MGTHLNGQDKLVLFLYRYKRVLTRFRYYDFYYLVFSTAYNIKVV